MRVWFIPLFILLLVTPAMGAHITAFNGVTVSTSDQVSTVRLALNQVGNVTVVFDKGYTLDTVNTTLVINFTANITSYSYSASGDTANLTVTRNPTNITFTYSGPTSVTISSVNLTFDFGPKLTTSEGIPTSSAMTKPTTLAYVSEFNKTYTPDTTPEKIEYIVYDPLKVYVESFKLLKPENATMVITNNTIEINLINATTNDVQMKITVNRGEYTDALVPLQSGYIILKLNDTYITAPVVLSTINCTELGSFESNGTTTIKFIDTATNYTKQIVLDAYFWDTNGTLDNLVVVSYNIDPIGGLPTTVNKTYNLNVTTAGAVPSGPMFWAVWKYEFLGIPLLAWFGIITAVVFFILVIYRVSKGMRPIPKSASAQIAVVAMFTYLTFLAVLKDIWKQAFTWVANNPFPSMVIFTLIFVLLLLAKAHLMSTRE